MGRQSGNPRAIEGPRLREKEKSTGGPDLVELVLSLEEATVNFLRIVMCLVLIGIPLVASGQQPENAGEEVCVLETSMGTMVFRFFEEGAPLTVANLKKLVADGFYDGLPFYRVVAGHVIQAGDGGENDKATVKGEFGAYPHVTGAVGLARDENPDSGSTEIYICHVPRPHLDGRYAVFGLLIEGFDVLDAIGKVEVDEEWLGDDKAIAFHKPKKEVVIVKARLERRVLGPAPKPIATEEAK